MSDLARLHQSGQALAVAQADLARAKELGEGAAGALGGVDAEVAQAVHVMAPSWLQMPSLIELEDWLSRRVRVLEARDTVRAAERDLHAAQADAREALSRLCAALERAGIVQAAEADFGTLLAEAQFGLESEAQRKRLYAELEDRRRDVARREHSAERAEAQQRDWVEAWSATCRNWGLAEAGAVPALGVVRETLTAVADLAPALEKRAGLIDRIDKMEKIRPYFAMRWRFLRAPWVSRRRRCRFWMSSGRSSTRSGGRALTRSAARSCVPNWKSPKIGSGRWPKAQDACRANAEDDRLLRGRLADRCCRTTGVDRAAPCPAGTSGGG